MTEEISQDSKQKRRLSAIMFTDIKGFTSMMESDEGTAVGLVKAQREIIRRYIALHNGEERETIGDAFLVIFDSAVDAVQSAIDIQREIWEFNQTREKDKQVWVRIGIHLGDILIEEGSVFGEGVNLAARIEPLAEPGGICITRQVYDQIKHHVELSVAHIGIRDLKNVKDVPDIYRIRLSTTAPREPLTLKERFAHFAESRTRVAIASTILALIIGISIYWTFFALHISYATNIGFTKHQPFPINEINKIKIHSLNRYYKFTKKAGHIIRVEEIKKPDLLPKDAQRLWDFGPARRGYREFPIHEFKYSRGKVMEEDVFDRYGVLQYKTTIEKDGKVATIHDRLGYIKTFENQIASFAFEFDDKGNIIQIENRNAYGMPRSDNQGASMYKFIYNAERLPIEESTFDQNGNPIDDKEGISIKTYTYNKDRVIEKEAYFDRYRSPHESANGVAAIERTFDKDGRISVETYLDRNGKPSLTNDCFCAKQFEYDSHGRNIIIATLGCQGTPRASRLGYAIKRYDYDGKNIVKESYFDDKGTPTTDINGIGIITAQYDDTDHISQLSFFGPDGKPVVNEDHVHAIRYFYNEHGDPSKRIYLGLDGNATVSNQGYSEVRVQYDSREDAVEWTYFDTTGEPINTRNGYSIVKNEFDQFGNLTTKAFFDKSNEPAMGRDEACHQIQMKYDDKGDLIESRCFDPAGNLTPGIKNCAITNYSHDNLGKLVKVECYAAEGKLVDAPSIPSTIEIKYDKRGYLAEVRAYDAAGNLAERYQGAAIWKRVSDEYGNQLEIATYDRNEKLINNPKYNAAIFRREYDGQGREIRSLVFDEQGKPSPGIWGFSEIRYKYDERGNKTSTSYFDGDGNPTHNLQGIHEYRTTYDDKGRTQEVANLGDHEEPIADVDGVSFLEYTYDQWGQVESLSYLDVNKNPVVHKRLHAALQKFTNDERGNTVQVVRYDTQGNLCREKNCIAITVQEFNPKGQMVRQIFRDADQNPMPDEEGAYGYENDYNIEGNISIQRVLGADGKLGPDKYGVFEYKPSYRPNSSNVWFTQFADVNGNPARSNIGADLRIILYDHVYLEKQHARIDVGLDGNIALVTCLDEAGNETDDTNCTNQSEVLAELSKIRSLLSPQAIHE